MWAIGCILGEITDGQPLFPGESEIDQLFVIQKVLGPLTADQMELCQKNPRFIGVKFPEVTKPETLEKKYLGKLSKKALAFMKMCLKMDPADRISATEALQHPYFEGLRDSIPSTPASSDCLRIESAKPSTISTNKLNVNAVNTSITCLNKVMTNNVPVTQSSNQKMTTQPSQHIHEKKSQTNVGTPIHMAHHHTESNSTNTTERSRNHQMPTKNSKPSIGAGPANRSGSLEKPVERSSSLNKTANRLEKLYSVYDAKKALKDAPHLSQNNLNNNIKKSTRGYENDHIDPNFNVPDVFMKTKYGSTAQYNYEIAEQNESDQEHSSPHKPSHVIEERKPRDTHQNHQQQYAQQQQQQITRGKRVANHDHYRGDSEENRASSYGPAKKASVSSTSTNIRKKSKFTHAYNDGNDTSESTVVGTKSKLISKFRNQTMPNEGPDGDLEASTHNLGGDPHDSQTFSSGQLPYLSKRHGAEKMTPNPYDGTADGQKHNANPWKGTRNSQHLNPAMMSSHFEVADGEIKHYNIIYNNNTFNYNINSSSWNGHSKRKF